MKIIISHDVDHLHSTEHIFHDLIIEKFWARAVLHLLQKKISFHTFLNHLIYPFLKRYERIDEVMAKDSEFHIPSTFFLGMEKGLGMAYGHKKAAKFIKHIIDSGFEAGVHGIDFENMAQIQKEYDEYAKIVPERKFGIRMHYVRFNQDTFQMLNQAGYLFDSTEFNKKESNYKGPYKVANMWEFPLNLMDSYIIKRGYLTEGIDATKKAIKEAEELGLPVFTILYHDGFYNSAVYPDEKAWYDWLLNYLKENHYEFISYVDAVDELERMQGNG